MAVINEQAKVKAIAEAMADSILNRRDSVDALFAKYNEDSTAKTPMQVLKYIENRVRVDRTFREDYAKLIMDLYGGNSDFNVRKLPATHSLYRAMFGEIASAIASIVETAGVITTATNKGAQRTAQSQAEVALREAQAQEEIARQESAAKQAAAKQKTRTIIIVSVIGGVVILGAIGLIFYFKYKKNQ